jgi:hypothetical protein
MTMIGLLSVAMCSFGRAEDSTLDERKKEAMKAFKKIEHYSAQAYADAAKPILVMDGVEIGASIADCMRLPAAVRFSAGFWLSVNAVREETENKDGSSTFGVAFI